MSRRRASVACSVGALLASVASGCGGSSEPDPSDLAGGPVLPAGTVSCAADPRLDTYTANLDKNGELGVLSFQFSDLVPAPPAKGRNTFHVRVTDASGALMTGGLRVALRMPDHGHGTSVKPVVSLDTVTGEYKVAPLYLFMAGVWRIEFEAHAGEPDTAPPLDRLSLHFCIQG